MHLQECGVQQILWDTRIIIGPGGCINHVMVGNKCNVVQVKRLMHQAAGQHDEAVLATSAQLAEKKLRRFGEVYGTAPVEWNSRGLLVRFSDPANAAAAVAADVKGPWGGMSLYKEIAVDIEGAMVQVSWPCVKCWSELLFYAIVIAVTAEIAAETGYCWFKKKA
jgi:hypothetical protein